MATAAIAGQIAAPGYPKLGRRDKAKGRRETWPNAYERAGVGKSQRWPASFSEVEAVGGMDIEPAAADEILATCDDLLAQEQRNAALGVIPLITIPTAAVFMAARWILAAAKRAGFTGETAGKAVGFLLRRGLPGIKLLRGAIRAARTARRERRGEPSERDRQRAPREARDGGRGRAQPPARREPRRAELAPRPAAPAPRGPRKGRTGLPVARPLPAQPRPPPPRGALSAPPGRRLPSFGRLAQRGRRFSRAQVRAKILNLVQLRRKLGEVKGMDTAGMLPARGRALLAKAIAAYRVVIRLLTPAKGAIVRADPNAAVLWRTSALGLPVIAATPVLLAVAGGALLAAATYIANAWRAVRLAEASAREVTEATRVKAIETTERLVERGIEVAPERAGEIIETGLDQLVQQAEAAEEARGATAAAMGTIWGIPIWMPLAAVAAVFLLGRRR